MQIVPFYTMTIDNIQEVAEKSGRSGGDLTKMMINASSVGWTRVKVPALISIGRWRG